MSAQAAATHEMFLDRLGTSGGSCTATEVANAIASASTPRIAPVHRSTSGR